MSVRLQLKGQLHDLKMKKTDLSKKIDANMNAVKDLLATSATTPLKDIRLNDALVHIQEAHDQQKEYLKVCSDIETIQKELE